MITIFFEIFFMICLWAGFICVMNVLQIKVSFLAENIIFFAITIIMLFFVWGRLSIRNRDVQKNILSKSHRIYSVRDFDIKILPPAVPAILFLIFLISFLMQIPYLDRFLTTSPEQLKKTFDYLSQYSSQLRATYLMLICYILFMVVFTFLSFKAFFIATFKDIYDKTEIREAYWKWFHPFGTAWIKYLTWAALLRHSLFNSKAWDLAIFAQLIENFKNGIFFEANIRGVSNIFSDHFTPIIYVFSPLLNIWNDPSRLLLIVQAAFIVWGAVPTYNIARIKTGSPITATALAYAYLLLPALQFLNLADFHPITLAIPFLLYAWLQWERRSYALMYLFIFLAMMCQEEVWVLVGSMGLFLFLFEKERKHGLILTLIGWGGFYLLITRFFPYFREGEAYFYFHRYAYLGSNASEIIRNFFLHPELWISKLFSPRAFMFAVLMLLPVGFLPLWHPKYLLILFPTFLYSALSLETLQISMFAQYAAPYIPFLMIAMVYGITNASVKLRKHLERFVKETQGRGITESESKSLFLTACRIVGFTILIASTISNIFLSPMPHGYAFQESQLIKDDKAWDIERAMESVEKDKSLCVGSKFAPHLIKRELYLFPDCENADQIIIDLDDYHDHAFKDSLRWILLRKEWRVFYFQKIIILERERQDYPPLQKLIDEYYAPSLYLNLPFRNIKIPMDDLDSTPIEMKHLRLLDYGSIYCDLNMRFLRTIETDEHFIGVLYYNNTLASDGIRFRQKPLFFPFVFGDNLCFDNEWVDIAQPLYISDVDYDFGSLPLSKERFAANPTAFFFTMPFSEDYPNTLDEFFMETYIRKKLWLIMPEICIEQDIQNSN